MCSCVPVSLTRKHIYQSDKDTRVQVDFGLQQNGESVNPSFALISFVMCSPLNEKYATCYDSLECTELRSTCWHFNLKWWVECSIQLCDANLSLEAYVVSRQDKEWLSQGGVLTQLGHRTNSTSDSEICSLCS